MFSLWVCPDCRRVGRRGGVAPALAQPGGLNPIGEETFRPGGMAIAVSSWICTECGQTGELVESRECVVEEVAPGIVAELRRNPLFIGNRDAEVRIADILIPVCVIVLLFEGIVLFNSFWH